MVALPFVWAVRFSSEGVVETRADFGAAFAMLGSFLEVVDVLGVLLIGSVGSVTGTVGSSIASNTSRETGSRASVFHLC